MNAYRENCHKIDDLMATYGYVLDKKEFESWLGLFADECAYNVFSLDNVERGLPLAYMMDDNRARLLDRVKFIEEVWAGTIDPYRTRHTIQRNMTVDLGDGLYEVHSNFIVAYTEASGTAGIIAMGHYEDTVQVNESGALFVSKNAYIDNTPPRYLVYPL